MTLKFTRNRISRKLPSLTESTYLLLQRAGIFNYNYNAEFLHTARRLILCFRTTSCFGAVHRVILIKMDKQLCGKHSHISLKI